MSPQRRCDLDGRAMMKEKQSRSLVLWLCVDFRVTIISVTSSSMILTDRPFDTNIPQPCGLLSWVLGVARRQRDEATGYEWTHPKFIHQGPPARHKDTAMEWTALIRQQMETFSGFSLATSLSLGRM